MTNAKRRKELLALADSWEEGVRFDPVLEHPVRELRAAVDRLYPLTTAEPEPEEPHPIVTFPVIGGGVYGVSEEKVAELSKLYEVPEAFLVDQFGIVAAKIQAGAVSKKTKRGMSKALFAWSATAKSIYDRKAAYNLVDPDNHKLGAPAETNGKPRLVRMAGEDLAIFRGQTWRQEQWPAEYGPWPGGA